MTEYPAPFADRAPTHPGAMLAVDVLPALGLNVTRTANLLGVSRQSMHAVLSGRASVTPAMAARLGKLCGNGAGLWLRMQVAHDLWRVEHEMADQIASIETLHAA